MAKRICKKVRGCKPCKLARSHPNGHVSPDVLKPTQVFFMCSNTFSKMIKSDQLQLLQKAKNLLPNKLINVGNSK